MAEMSWIMTMMNIAIQTVYVDLIKVSITFDRSLVNHIELLIYKQNYLKEICNT